MASNNEDGLCENHIKLDRTQIEDVRALNSTFPRIDNLEYFPQIVLVQIFCMVGDIDLMSLATISSRFERIARIALNQRDKYVTIDGSMYRSQAYRDFIRLFGSDIKSLEVKETDAQDDVPWMGSVLSRMNCLEKLRWDVPSTVSNVLVLEQHASANITHLSLHGTAPINGDGFVLSKFRNLKQFSLESYPSISMDTFKEVIFKNPALESLSIGHKYGLILNNDWPRLGRLDLFMRFIGMNLNRLKKLSLRPIYQNFNEPTLDLHLALDPFVTSMKNLESLFLPTFDFPFEDRYELLRRLGTGCKSIKHLKFTFHGDDAVNKRLFSVISFFEKLESLTFDLFWIDAAGNANENKVWSFILKLLQKCQFLKKIIINTNNKYACVEAFGTARFFSHVIRCIQMRNIVIEVKYQSSRTIKHIGTITSDQVIWRNKLLHWMGYDPSLNSSNVHFMDLANQCAAPNAKQPRNPFDVILGYLDLNSLQSLSNTNRKCSQLVESYVMYHSRQNGAFLFTNEFFTDLNEEYKRLSSFTEHVTNLRMNIIHDRVAELRVMLQQFDNLKKLYVRTDFYVDSMNLIVPQVRHFIFDGPEFQVYFQLRVLSTACPHLETLEFKQKNMLRLRFIQDDVEEEDQVELKEEIRLKFKNLKELKLTYGNDEQMRQLHAMFKDTNTKLLFTNRRQHLWL